MTPSSVGAYAEVGQLIASIKFVSFLTPDMASKSNARHYRVILALINSMPYLASFSDTISGVKKMTPGDAVLACFPFKSNRDVRGVGKIHIKKPAAEKAHPKMKKLQL